MEWDLILLDGDDFPDLQPPWCFPLAMQNVLGNVTFQLGSWIGYSPYMAIFIANFVYFIFLLPLFCCGSGLHSDVCRASG